MGGSYNNSKGNGNGGGHGSSSSRGRSYGLMLVMAFGAALLGVMVLHKLRERRIFNLLIKGKDSDLISLHLLLQKERDYTKELKRKNEEMKTKLYSTRTQKMELDRRVLELKSTVDSLKEELQTMEAALDEKQSEIKVLRGNSENGNPQVMELLESLKQKEAEIEDLKHRIESPVKVWSVSTDDPSKPLANLTLSESVAGEEKAEVIEKKRPGEDGISGNKSISLRGGENTTQVEDQIGNREGETDRREMMDRQSEKLDNSRDGNIKHGGTEEAGQGKKSEGVKDGDGSGTGTTESHLTNAAETTSDTNRKDFGNNENSELNESQKLNATAEGGTKLEMQENSEGGERSIVRGRHGFSGGDRRRKWRLIAKYRRLGNKGSFKGKEVGSVRSSRFFKDDQNGFMGREEEAASNRRLTGENQNAMEVDKALYSSYAKNLELQNPKNTDKGITDDDSKQKMENLDNRDIKRPENSDEQMKSADAHDLPDDLEVADAEEQEKEAIDDNLFDESGFNLEEDKDEYREEIDESEF